MTKISTDLGQNICKLYYDGYGTVEIAELFDLHRATVQRFLIKNKIPLRNGSPYKKKYNVHYFDEYTYENCYWAGFILADGNVSSSRDAIEIGLQKSDKNHLIKFANAINLIGEPYYNKSNDAYHLTVAGAWFPNALKKKFGILPQKSLKCKFPKQLPSKYWPSFIRGIFDGDGSAKISITKYSNVPVLSIIGTISLIDFLRKLFFSWGVRLKSKNKFAPIMFDSNAKSIGTISYSGSNAMKIYNILYANSSDDFRLERKYNIYSQYIAKYNEILK
jgi:hypothetical protein